MSSVTIFHYTYLFPAIYLINALLCYYASLRLTHYIALLLYLIKLSSVTIYLIDLINALISVII